jgi:hypothetical protein
VRLARPAARDDLGTATLTLSVPSAPSARTARATTTTGYELAVIAAQDGAEVGRTRLTLPVGAVPTLRLRATPTLARAGEAVQIEVLRGPDWSGTLPREVVLYEGSLEVDRAELDPDTRTATFQLPEGVDGFLHVDVGGARAVVFVAPAGPLEVALSTDAAAYRPGERATLTVRTTAGGVGQAAGVGLVGVDQSLSQLAPLLGPDELGRVTVRASSDRPAFDAFDARALALGQVRGEHAALAAVLRISSVPTDPAGDERLYASATSTDDAEAALLTGFYRTYEALVPLVRAWEAEAPAGEVMDPARMVALWDAALDVVEAAGTPPVDGYGRRLRLPVLPGDLLRQVDPRQVVADGTRLPEDVVDWERFVAREVR